MVKIFLINSGLVLELCFSWHSGRLHLILLGSQAVRYCYCGQEAAGGLSSTPSLSSTQLAPYGIRSTCAYGVYAPYFDSDPISSIASSESPCALAGKGYAESCHLGNGSGLHPAPGCSGEGGAWC